MIEQIKAEIRKELVAENELHDKITDLESQYETIRIKKYKIFGSYSIPALARLFQRDKVKAYEECEEVLKVIDVELESLKNTALLHSSMPYKSTLTLDTLDNAKSLVDLGMTFDSAQAFLKSKGIQPVLRENDSIDALNKTSDYVLVHLTDYAPEDDQIKRLVDRGKKKEYSGKFGKFEVQPGRETTHLRVNGTVVDTGLDSWANKRIAVIIPMSEIPEDAKVTSYRSADFTIKDKVDLTSKCYILCPKEMVEIIQKENPSVQVVGFEGQKARPYAAKFIQMLGYKYIDSNDHGFVSEAEEKGYQRKMSQKFKNASNDEHLNTIEKAEETVVGGVNMLKGIQEGFISGTIISRKESIEELSVPINNAIEGILDCEKESPNISSAKEEFVKMFGLQNVEEIKKHTKEEYIKMYVSQLLKLMPRKELEQTETENKTL